MTSLESVKKALAPVYASARQATIVRYITQGFSIAVVLMYFFNSQSVSPFLDSQSASPFGSIIPLFLLLALANLALYFFYIKPKQNAYQDQLKQAIHDLVFAKAFENTRFLPKHGFDKSLMKNLALIDLGNVYTSNDHLSGRYNGVDFERADVHSETQTTDSEGNTSTTVEFKGQVYRFDFHKETHRYVRIRSRGGFFGKFSRGRKVSQAKGMTFEDDEFNSMFRTVSNDEQEAFYIFTPHFMEKIKNLQRRLGHEISIIINESILYCAVYSSTDSFELSNTKEISQAFVDQVTEDVEIIKIIIDDLGINSRLFRDVTDEEQVQ